MRKPIRFVLGLTFIGFFIWSSIFLQPSIERATAWAGNLLSLKLAGTYAQGCSSTQIEVLPSNPTTTDNVTIRLSGQWSDGCVPTNPVVTVAGGEIRINTSNSSQVCIQVITPWSLSVPVGRLAARTYQVIATHSSPRGQCELGRRNFTIGTQPTTVVAHTMSGGPIPGCPASPVPKFKFAPTDASAYQWAIFAGVTAGDVVRRDFISPNGALIFTSSDVFPSNGSFCAWDSMPIAGQPAASLPGNWQVRVYYNGAQILTENFTISGSALTIVDHKVTGGPVSPTSCVSPPLKSIFAPTDERVYQWTRFTGIRAGDVVRRDFISPNGALFFTSSDVFPARDDNCAWDSIPIVGNPAASLPGNWQARVFYNSALILTENFTITSLGSPPTLTALSPNSAIAGGQGFTLTVNGSNFVPGSVVRWNGADRTTTVVSATQLLAAIPAGDIAVPSMASVTVFNPAPGGGLSNALSFTITPEISTGGAVIIDGTSANVDGSATAGVNRNGWLYMQKALESLAARALPGTARVVVDLGSSSGTARNAINSAFDLSPLPQAGWTLRHEDGVANITTWLTNISTANTGILYIPTYNLASGDLIGSEMAAINAQAGRIANFVNNGGALFAMGEQDTIPMPGSWRWLLSLYPNIDGSASGSGTNITLTPDGMAAFPGLDNLDLINAVRWQFYFTGDIGNLKVLATAPQGSNTRQVILGNLGSGPPPQPCTLEITSFSPTSGPAGTNVTLTGRGFTGVNSVKFANNVAATFTINSDTQITATVPNGAVTGPIIISKPNCPDAQSSANFTVEPPHRVVRTVCANSSPGGTVAVPIMLDSQGDENALGFSFNFDPAILAHAQTAVGSDAAGTTLNLNTSQVGQGRLGVALTLPSGRTFAAGARQVAVITFNVSASTTATSTPVGFGDAPVRREVSNVNAQVLNANYQGCTIDFRNGGYEADVAPRPNGTGDGTVTITDWVQVGRFAAGLDTAAAGSEFQRADCAPRETKGNGQISITDWVQAGRYAAALDSVQTAGGPTSPTAFGPPMNDASALNAFAHPRVVRVLNATFQRGQANTLELEIEAEGDENAIGLSLNFDPSMLAFVSASAGSGAPNAVLNVNANQAANGRLGVALALPAGQLLRAGKQTIVTVRFNSLASSNVATTTIGFGDAPIRRQLSDVNAVAVAASYGDGSVNLVNSVANVSAASFRPEIAAESIVAAFGASLATTTASAATLPLPTSLAGTTVKIKDSAGVERLAPIFFVAPSQVNYLASPEAAPGVATVTITSGNGTMSAGTINIATVAPSLFTANADGQGAGAIVVVRVRPDGSQVFESAVRFDPAQNRFVAAPIDLGAENEQVVLLMFGTGLRHRSALSAVSVNIGGVNAPVDYAGPQPDFAGLDQINARLPRSLAGRGEVDVVVRVDEKTANTIKAFIR